MNNVVHFDTSGISSIMNLIHLGKRKLFIVHYSSEVKNWFEIMRNGAYLDGMLVFPGVDFRMFARQGDLLDYLNAKRLWDKSQSYS